MLSDILRDITVTKIKINTLKEKPDSSSEINPNISEDDFQALLINIKKEGQNDPIYIWRNSIVDGRARVKALKKLSVEFVYVKKLPHKMGKSEREKIAFMKEKRRHQTPTQKACKAVIAYHKVTASYRKSKGYDQESYAEASGASIANLRNANYIYKHNRQWFDLLKDGKKIEYKNNFTDSLKVLVAHLREEEKKQEKINKPSSQKLEILENEEIHYNGKKYVYDKILMGLELGNKENHFKNPKAEEVTIEDVIKFLQQKLLNE